MSGVVLILSGLSLITLLITIWLYNRAVGKRRELKESCTIPCHARVIGVVNYNERDRYRMSKLMGAASAVNLLAGGSLLKSASLGAKSASMALYFFPVYRYTYLGNTYEEFGGIPDYEEKARQQIGTELTLYIDPSDPTRFYCEQEDKGYRIQHLTYYLMAAIIIGVLIMTGVIFYLV